MLATRGTRTRESTHERTAGRVVLSLVTVIVSVLIVYRHHTLSAQGRTQA